VAARPIQKSRRGETAMHKLVLALLATAAFSAPAFAAQQNPPQTSKHSEVRLIQMTLNKDGFASGPVDGIFGPHTRDALMNFQKVNGIHPTGNLTHRTLADLHIKANVQANRMANAQNTNMRPQQGNMSNAQGQQTANAQGMNNNSQQVNLPSHVKKAIEHSASNINAEKAPSNFQARVGEQVPSSLTLHNVPNKVAKQDAALRNDKLARLQSDKILVVSPNNDIVAMINQSGSK
jgi:peptidoglycan hydrolase-like protein with peptidoglycan-binding domain